MSRLCITIFRATCLIGSLIGCASGSSNGSDEDRSLIRDSGRPQIAGETGQAGSNTSAGDIQPEGGFEAAGYSGSTPQNVSSDPEICDGIDNDNNGIVDDVDVEGDGVCDCLNIATIGEIGPWSDGGNVFRDWLNNRSPQPAVELADQILTDDLLRPFQVVIVLYTTTSELNANGRVLEAHHPFSEQEVAAFERWVRAGGGAMTTIGYVGDEASGIVNVNRLLAPLGMGYSSTKLHITGYIEEWIDHALTSDVSRIFTDNGVEPDGPAGLTLAYDSGNRVALQVAEVDEGRIVVWADEWITYDSQWVDIEDQQVERLWLNILKWLSPPDECQVPLPEVI